MATLRGEGEGTLPTPAPPQQQRQPSGCARRRREQRQRQSGRHVRWLTSLLQSTAAHHTAPQGAQQHGGHDHESIVADLRIEVAKLQGKLLALEKTFADVQKMHLAHVTTETVTKAEQQRLAQGAAAKAEQTQEAPQGDKVAENSQQSESEKSEQDKEESEQDKEVFEGECIAPDDTAVKLGLVEYLVDNGRLRAATPGLGYRRSKRLDDREPGDPVVEWAASVVGVDQGDGWLRVHGRFLPMHLEGCRVLSLADGTGVEDEG